MIEPTDEMLNAFLDVWDADPLSGQRSPELIAAGLAAVLAIVERDYRVSQRKGPVPPPCGAAGPDGHHCELNPHRAEGHAAYADESGELVRW